MIFKNSIDLKQLLPQFSIDGKIESVKPFGTGHINSTFISVWNQDGQEKKFIHQRINEKIFPHPELVMENISRVTNHIRKIAMCSGLKDNSDCTLTIVPSHDGKLFVKDSEGGCWRTYVFINGYSLDIVRSPQDAWFLGKGIANFQKQLIDLNSCEIIETIPNFHNMPHRYSAFHEALLRDNHQRVKSVANEIAFMLENEQRGHLLIDSLNNGKIPLRICHNDAKLSNILIDKNTNEFLCVIDLDTVMPGSSLFDLGDLIRTVTTLTAEDEKDISKIDFDLLYFEKLLEGYLCEALDFLEPAEISLLCEAGRNITQIMGLRFLTDYLEGDIYYRIAHPSHNLDRCRTQIALIHSMDAKWEEALLIAGKLIKR